ncbi:hypothetical protein D0867_00371 [Hortaea werneckii]|uniref:Septin-type G domain-containing protein n=1 Tax=Hortaea werneckii TaxID=91943 RepID=A0A3M7ARI1_HORWE|nr:hypothetical protein D0867_00371 [Hortaea werneckii]RMY29999.1 hypothetical protein D0866_08307 [Hortaea werneckii]
MAAAGITQADRLPPPEDFDYSKSHRPVPVPTTTPAASHAPSSSNQQHYASPAAVDHSLPGRPSTSGGSEGRRRGSFSRHFRIGSREDGAPPLPELPKTRIAQVTNHAAVGPPPDRPLPQPHAQPQPQPQHKQWPSIDNPPQQQPQQDQQQHSRAFSFGSGMLRKSSRMRKEEQERQAREAAAAKAVPRQPPHLPSFHHLPTIASFGGEDARPDSVAIFNHSQYPQSHEPPSQPAAPRPAPANFSRPGNNNNATTATTNMPSSSTFHSSSSPAYAYRPGNAFAQQAAIGQATSSPSNPPGSTNGEYVIDPTQPAHTGPETMAHRSRNSYTSPSAPVNVNSPRRIRRRKDPTPFNILVVGAKNSGKTSFLSFLRHSLAPNSNEQQYNFALEGDSHVHHAKSSFTSHYLETEVEGERMGLTLWDSAGLEKHIIDLQTREMVAFVESKFEETFVEEQKVMRSPGARDTHIHCVFLVLDPVRLDSTVAMAGPKHNGKALLPSVGGLDDELDLPVLRALWGKTTVIPIIGKADTLTIGHMGFLKRAVWESVKEANLDPLEALDLEGDDDEFEDDSDDDISEPRANGHSTRDDTDDTDTESSSNEGSAPLPKSARNSHNRQSSIAATVTSTAGSELPYLPLSVLSPDLYDLPPYVKPSKNTKIGRRFPWGFADPYNPEHCDFERLRDTIFADLRSDLRDLSRTRWYENWRTSRLKNIPGSRQRVRGGVTPIAAVPREGMTSPTTNRRDVSSGSMKGGAHAAAGAQAVPRSVSSGTTPSQQIGMAISSSPPTARKSSTVGSTGVPSAEWSLNGGGNPASGAHHGGTYRSVESYQ